MRLIESISGNTSKLVCPYHQWAYGNDGVCSYIPRAEMTFPELDLRDLKLQTKTVLDRGGLLWLLPDSMSEEGAELFFQPLEKHFQTWAIESQQQKTVESQEITANWKILQESFLEGYHVPFVHKKSLAPATIHNTWLIDYYGPHSRAVYPLKRFEADLELKKATLRRYASVVYQIFPNTLVSFQPFHAIVTNFCPVAFNRTRIESYVFVQPNDEQNSSQFTDRDIGFVKIGLGEDFTVAQKIQESLSSEYVTQFRAGCYEEQIEHFHRQLGLC